MLLAVALGGALGAVGRYLVTIQVALWFGTALPWGTFAVNICGSFLLGVVTALTTHFWSPPPEIRAMLAIGALGAFTTFSTVTLELVMFAERGDWGRAALYTAMSLACGVLALAVGLRLVRLAMP